MSVYKSTQNVPTYHVSLYPVIHEQRCRLFWRRVFISSPSVAHLFAHFEFSLRIGDFVGVEDWVSARASELLTSGGQ